VNATFLLVLLVVTDSLASAASQKQLPAPKTVSRDVRAACDAAYAVAAKTPGVKIQRRTGIFRDETLREPVYGCAGAAGRPVSANAGP
jgi:hypothetical protein